jgi:hypothetical protein
MTNKWFSAQALCTGVDAREPQYRFEKNRVVVSYELNKNQMRVGYYCETEDFARMIKPENIFSEQDRNERV